jgi:hypothetical protein
VSLKNQLVVHEKENERLWLYEELWETSVFDSAKLPSLPSLPSLQPSVRLPLFERLYTNKQDVERNRKEEEEDRQTKTKTKTDGDSQRERQRVKESPPPVSVLVVCVLSRSVSSSLLRVVLVLERETTCVSVLRESLTFLLKPSIFPLPSVPFVLYPVPFSLLQSLAITT